MQRSILEYKKTIILKNNRGITLIELLIALGILAGVIFTMSEILGAIYEIEGRAETRIEQRHSISTTFSKMMDDFSMAFQADKKFHGRDSRYLTGFEGDQTQVSFSTMSHVHFVKNKKDSDQVQVGYSLKKIEDKEGYILLRRSTDYLTSDLTKGGQTYPLLENVKELEFSYYDSNKEDWVGSWSSDSVSTANRLPEVVKVKMTVFGENELGENKAKERDYEFHFALPLYQAKVDF